MLLIIIKIDILTFIKNNINKEDLMRILTRFKDIMSSNINSLLDKVQDPEKLVD
ncbi:hypothetical protein OPLHCY645_15910 [Clostridium tetani]